MRKLIGMLLIAAGVLGGVYVGVWLMFIRPILEVCGAFDNGTLTAMLIGVTVFKVIFAGVTGIAIIWLGFVLGAIIIQLGGSDDGI